VIRRQKAESRKQKAESRRTEQFPVIRTKESENKTPVTDSEAIVTGRIDKEG